MTKHDVGLVVVMYRTMRYIIFHIRLSVFYNIFGEVIGSNIGPPLAGGIGDATGCTFVHWTIWQVLMAQRTPCFDVSTYQANRHIDVQRY